MKPEDDQRIASGGVRAAGGMPSGIFRRGKPTRELFFVKFAFWTVVLGFILLMVFVLWGLATHEPSHFPLDSAD